jgi:hypothetical protein
MRLTQEDFLKGLDLLSSVYGDDYPVFKHPDIAQIWLEFFVTRCTPGKFFKLIKHYVQMCPFFPRVPNDICKVWSESGDERPPGENWLMNQQRSLLALPSQEAADKVREMEELANLSPEKLAENRKRATLLYLIINNLKSMAVDEEKIKYLHTAPLHEVEAIASTCEKAKQLAVVGDKHGNLKANPDALFEDMRKYFHSGSEKYRQVAIDWASNPNNGCQLIRDGGRVVDLELVDF